MLVVKVTYPSFNCGAVLSGLLSKVVGEIAEKTGISKLLGKITGLLRRTSKRLPATTEASVADKLEKYLLNFAHPEGRSKAKWFQEALGFTKENLADLAKQIKFDAAKAFQTAVTEYGTKFNQVIEIVGANGNRIEVTFAWIRNKDGVVRLVTAIPSSR